MNWYTRLKNWMLGFHPVEYPTDGQQMGCLDGHPPHFHSCDNLSRMHDVLIECERIYGYNGKLRAWVICPFQMRQEYNNCNWTYQKKSQQD